jgi:hypothetical protein
MSKLQEMDKTKKPFNYEQVYHGGNGDEISQVSREKKMPDRINHTRGGERVGSGDNAIPDFAMFENRSVEYYPPATPPAHNVGVQPSIFDKSILTHQSIGKSSGVHASKLEKSSSAHASKLEKSSSATHDYKFEKSVGVQGSGFDRSAGNQVGASLENPFPENSIGTIGNQSNLSENNKGIQADEEPLKDAFMQCDLSENNKGIQADAELVSRGQSVGSDSLLNPLLEQEIQIVDKNSEASEDTDDNNIDFS